VAKACGQGDQATIGNLLHDALVNGARRALPQPRVASLGWKPAVPPRRRASFMSDSLRMTWIEIGNVVPLVDSALPFKRRPRQAVG
jgi:hypothetical protein